MKFDSQVIIRSLISILVILPLSASADSIWKSALERGTNYVLERDSNYPFGVVAPIRQGAARIQITRSRVDLENPTVQQRPELVCDQSVMINTFDFNKFPIDQRPDYEMTGAICDSDFNGLPVKVAAFGAVELTKAEDVDSPILDPKVDIKFFEFYLSFRVLANTYWGGDMQLPLRWFFSTEDLLPSKVSFQLNPNIAQGVDCTEPTNCRLVGPESVFRAFVVLDENATSFEEIHDRRSIK